MCVLIFTKDVGGADKTKGTDSANAVAIAVPVVLLILLIPAVLAAVYFYRRYAIHWCATVRPDEIKTCSKMRDAVNSRTHLSIVCIMLKWVGSDFICFVTGRCVCPITLKMYIHGQLIHLNHFSIFLRCFMMFRRKRSGNKSSNEKATPLQLEDLRSGSTDATSSSANLVYQNLVDIRPSEEGAVFLVLFIDYTKIIVK